MDEGGEGGLGTPEVRPRTFRPSTCTELHVISVYDVAATNGSERAQVDCMGGPTTNPMGLCTVAR